MAAVKEPIAIIGSACRFPGGASSPSKLWDLLKEPRDVLTDIPKERLVLSNFYNKDGSFHGSTNVKNKSYLLSEDIRAFDAPFFQINALEAESMDPAQRILLETVYEAMEAAGSVDDVRGSQTSVFVGLMTADWWDLQMRDTEILPTYAATGTARSIVANRISYFFDLKGASMTIDTACSSSLVALHQAVQNLRNSESKTAIVAGANLILDPAVYISESKLHMLSPDSRSRMWDKTADGYARGEGCAAVLLKRLSDAIADGDHIESVIRETGVNSDGRTKGITMPSASAQAELIRSTYHNAGLDPTVDRCQFFECHGTGTPAGDPIEAQAISETFFPAEKKHEGSSKMYVGSIKTIIGHLEGCSGLAGVLKASLAIQNRTVPANLLFNELNPAIEPYYSNLEILQSSMAWPETSESCRRASVNSFGFGGTNAHAILESYDAEPVVRQDAEEEEEEEQASLHGPLLFSACSSSSLVTMIREHAQHIRSNPSLRLDDLAWLVRKKRSLFDVKHIFSAPSRDLLLQQMDAFVETADPSSAGSRPQLLYPDDAPAVLGVFTGQGAQWATMGASLIHNCRLFAESIERSEAVLAALPDPPSWSLKQELLAPKETSRLNEALLSQPLCTALQIAMVDLATAAGVRFNATVGHSSGEIAATYAAGILSSADAMAIAYYRGYHASLACGPDGKQGGMLAVAISYEAAAELCAKPQWAGRISPAASNSPSSVTISGDIDAVQEAKAHFDAEKTFARQLVVDTAYHSHHMLPCAEAYLASLQACNITVNQPHPSCTWCSSVRGDAVMEGSELDLLKGQYWVDNMVKPVLFAEAVENSIWNGGPFEVVIEMGPHPALKGPVTQVLKSVLDSCPPYLGLLRRGEDAIETFSHGLGQVWVTLGPSFVDFEGYDGAFASEMATPRMFKGLPSYPWDHDKVYWKEGRISRNYRLRKNAPHELLGRRLPDDTDDEMRWRNILRLSELGWMRGHGFKGQVLFPAAAHVTMAIEASKYLKSGRSVKLIELRDVTIHHSIVLEEGSPGIETTFTLKVLNQAGAEKDVMEAEFSSYTFVDEASGASRKTLSGRIIVHVGDERDVGLPPVEPTDCQMSVVDAKSFYTSMESLGLDYQGLFRGLTRAERSQDHARTTATWQGQDDDDDDEVEKYLVHPALLDLAFQANLIPLASATTHAVERLFLPTRLHRLIVDPNQSRGLSRPGAATDIDAFVTYLASSDMMGDVHVLNSSGTATSIQVEGLCWKLLADDTPGQDNQLFSRTVWEMDITSGAIDVGESNEEDVETCELIDTMERSALLYFRDLVGSVSAEEIKTFAWHHQRFFEAIAVMLEDIRCGRNAVVQEAWLEDTRETIDELHTKFPGQIELQLMAAISEQLVSVVRGKTQMLEVMMQADMLNRFYMEGAFARRLNASIARVTRQLAHKYPRAKFLEIGAGTGGTTRSILDSIGSRYASYTYTDISSGFFQRAADKFADDVHKMTFCVLDIEKDVASQGFDEGGYDVIVAANVLHATRNLAETMQHTRSLLKPGGYLILMEATGKAMAATYIMGALPGWWLGVDDGRRLHPGVSVSEWDGLLRRAHFSGVDAVTYDFADLPKHTFSVMVTQAVDEPVAVVRDPLAASLTFAGERLLVVGGASPAAARLRQRVQALLTQWSETVVVDTIDELDLDPDLDSIGGAFPSVLCLTELDAPLLASPMTDGRLRKLQQLFAQARRVLWLTSGAAGADPLSNMVVGLGRSLPAELPHLALQFLDIDSARDASPASVAAVLLRLVAAGRSDAVQARWTMEPELRLVGDGLWVPRIVPDEAMNHRVTARRRPVLRRVAKSSARVELGAKDGANGALGLREATPLAAVEGARVVDVDYSIALGTRCFLSMGRIRGAAELAMTVSHVDATSIEAPSVFIVPRASQAAAPADATLLLHMATQLLAQHIVQHAPAHGRALVYEPGTEGLGAAIASQARRAAKTVLLATATTTAVPAGWLSLPLHGTERALRRLVPHDIACFIALGPAPQPALVASLPRAATVHQLSEPDLDPSRLDATVLSAAYTAVLNTTPAPSTAPPATVHVQDLAGAVCATRRYPTIVDWTRHDMTVAVRPLDTKSLLRPDRTYLLVGMTGDLGRSLCTWMLENGARHVVLTSRNATVDTAWLAETSHFGATVRVCRMDVSDRRSVDSVCATIAAELPPIAGVCNAAMVLQDQLFSDLTADALNKVLAPKVTGSAILDQVFGANGPELDFFVLFSSLASVFGNAGQANYHAANLFMEGLCARRRRSRLPASVMHIGFITDVGYVARSDRRFKEHLGKLSLKLMSQRDLHHLFAEAVANSHPDRCHGRSWNIIAGIDPFVDDGDQAPVRPPFYSNPRFAHYILDSRHVSAAAAAAAASSGSGSSQRQHHLLKRQLSAGIPEKEAAAAIEAAFADGLETMLQMVPNSVKPDRSLISLGLDSLIAVEIRAWFHKALDLDVPVLRILKGDSVASISADVARKLLTVAAE
ncbi:hypothetical protein ACET3X_007197 [Alternaria dauci]|uniref:Uncharacterized protein n=1 Tax=Alternaria dauci TaxID=48095 RepID=A0ABR3UIL9_9PLEO